jgi:hypothetical protein
MFSSIEKHWSHDRHIKTAADSKQIKFNPRASTKNDVIMCSLLIDVYDL